MALSAHCDYYQHCVCGESHNRQAHMLTAGLCTPPGDSKSRLKARLTFYDLVIFIWQYHIATTAPSTPSTTWSGRETAIHTLQENYGPLSRRAATWKKPRKPLSCSRFLLSLTDETPTPSLSFTFCRSQPATRRLCYRENYYFSISRATQKKRGGG